MFKYRNLLWAGVATLIAASTSLAQVPDSLANTEWSRQFENGSISLRFQDGERVLAIVSGNQGSGTYIQEGSNVTMTFSDGTFRGQVMGQTMNVSAVENTGRKFNFQLTRQENPVVNLGVNPAPQVNNTPQANTNPPANTGPVDAPKDVILQKVKVYDPLAKCDAVTLLVPKGWQKSGGLVWNFQKFSLVDLQLKVNDPKSLRQVEYLPKLAFVTLPQIPGIPNLPTGSYNLGLEVQQRQPVVDPRAFAEQYIVPRFRSGARVTDVKLLPKLAQAHQDGDPTGSVRFVAARVRLEYSVQTQAVEEDVYVVLYAMDPSVSPSVVWGAETVVALRSAKGQLDADSALLVPMAGSLRLELQWFADYQQAFQISLQMKQNNLDHVMIRSRIISQTGAQISDIIRSTYENRQRVMDKCNLQFSNYIRGVEQYAIPGQSSPVTLPSGYREVWGNGLGQYVLSNDSNVRQRLNGTNWQQLQVAP